VSEKFTLSYKKFVEYTNDQNARVRASAALAISSVSQAIAWKIDDRTIDSLLVMTSDGVKEVREAAAEALAVVTRFGQGREKMVRASKLYKTEMPKRKKNAINKKRRNEVVVEPVIVSDDEDVSDAVVVVAESEEVAVAAVVVEEEKKLVQTVTPVVVKAEDDDEIDEFFS